MNTRSIIKVLVPTLCISLALAGNLAELGQSPSQTKLTFTNPANDLRVSPEWEKVYAILKANDVSFPLMMCSISCGVTLFGKEDAISKATNDITRAILKGKIDNSLLQLRITTQQESGAYSASPSRTD